MSVDFPRAWEIARAVPPADHDERCSFAQTDGAVMCDCRVLTQHPDYVRDDMFITAQGARPRCLACPWHGRLWLTEMEAQHESVWHVYEKHHDVWLAAVGDRPPQDPDRRRLN